MKQCSQINNLKVFILYFKFLFFKLTKLVAKITKIVWFSLAISNIYLHQVSALAVVSTITVFIETTANYVYNSYFLNDVFINFYFQILYIFNVLNLHIAFRIYKKGVIIVIDTFLKTKVSIEYLVHFIYCIYKLWKYSLLSFAITIC